jgi:protein TonB
VGTLSYRDALSQHLARYRLYPADARRQRLQGTVRVRFLLERDGRVSQAWVDDGSGYPILDDEAEAAVHRASPFPAIPRNLPDRLDITLPVNFSLG